jgi:hypothetical protein
MATPPRHAPLGATMRSRLEVRAIRRGDHRNPGGGRTGTRGKSCWATPVRTTSQLPTGPVSFAPSSRRLPTLAVHIVSIQVPSPLPVD